MRGPSFSDWMQTITAAAVIVGLVLVIWELRQQREFAEAQHVGAGWDRFSASYQAMVGDEVSRSIAKACDHPESLTTEDMLVLRFYYMDVLTRIRAVYDLSTVTSLRSYDWRAAARGNFDIIFATSFGRRWWGSDSWEPEIREFGDNILAELPEQPACAGFIESLREPES